MSTQWIALAFVLHACTALATPPPQCSVGVPAATASGLVCGVVRQADGIPYASFRGVPYAKQPIGELRFKELQPAEPWDVLYATNEGPICLQTEVLYGRIMKNSSQSEACIYANIHVPLDALPPLGRRPISELPLSNQEEGPLTGLPILVFIHGGGFAFGSGNSDLHGPEYLVRKKVIVITFNYRLNVFGFLYLNNSKIPGNIGLRDQVTLLNWVQRNARAFGGNPDDVTLAGQSAGASAAHLLTMSQATERKGLFKRAILMSGTAASPFFSSSPVFAQLMTAQLLKTVGISSTNSDDIYRDLMAIDADKLKSANEAIIKHTGLTTFVPTVESPVPGITPIIDDDPENLIANGRGQNIPLIVGYTTAECETFRKCFENLGILEKIQVKPELLLAPRTLFMTPKKFLIDMAKEVEARYSKDPMTMDNFVKSCSEGIYEYPALKLAQRRAEIGGAPLYLYRFAYEGHSNVIKEAMTISYEGVGHIEDLTYVFKVNSILDAQDANRPSEEDISMKNLMTDFFVNFMTCSKPICEGNLPLWPASNGVQFEDIESPTTVQAKDLSSRQQDTINFFDSLTSRKELT